MSYYRVGSHTYTTHTKIQPCGQKGFTMAKNMSCLRLPNDIGRGQKIPMRRSGKRRKTTSSQYKRLQAIYQGERRTGGRVSSGGGSGHYIETRYSCLFLPKKVLFSMA